MKQIFQVLGRLVSVSAVTIVISTTANCLNHKGYWEGTISRVQTTDFNILSHMLPTKLSYALEQGHMEELQRTLNSNYGLFGMVVTTCTFVAKECPEQKIVSLTESDRSWRQELRLEDLPNHPYDLLLNPPPLLAEGSYTSSRDTTWNITGRVNSGRVIGRVYYIRGIPPKFSDLYWSWLSRLPSSLLSDHGAEKYYALTFTVFSLGGLASWSFIEWVFYRKRLQQRLASQENRRMLTEIQRLRRQLQERMRQISNLIVEREHSSFELASQEKSESDRVKELQRVIEQLENQQTDQQRQRGDAQLLKQNHETLQLEVQQREQIIIDLHRQLKIQRQGRLENTSDSMQLKQKLEELIEQQSSDQQKLEQHESRFKALQRELVRQEDEGQEKSKLIKILQKQLQDASDQASHTHQRQIELEQSVEELKQQKQQDDENLGNLEERIIVLSENQNGSIINEFQDEVVGQLQNSPSHKANQWRVLEEFDVGSGKSGRLFTDCLIISQSCVFVLEMKAYSGRIKADGDAQRTTWHCHQSDGTVREVKCPGKKRNPYEQVNAYCDGVINLLKITKARGKTVVYGIVVFPQGAEIGKIAAEIDGYSRVTTSDRLVQLLQDLEAGWNRSSVKRSNLSPEQIEALLCGRPLLRIVKRAA